ncbi:MAG: hypothetical protein ACI93N_001574 [Flavobacteriaceae bacterium]|jgi:hypothetical protein
MRYIYILFIFFISISCKNNSSTKEIKSNEVLFTKILSEKSNISFKNNIKQTKDFNFMNYMYIYTGAGAAVGDLDHDGLEDIYFISNFGPNKLYKNKGDFTFEDITVSSKTEDYSGFSSGATMLDINNDGWLDIYVSKAGSLKNDNDRRNLLFVNQKDGTFKEDAKKWGIDDPGYSTQAYSLDYDKDGDLDLYVVNHRYDFINNSKINGAIQNNIEETTSDHLYRNDGTVFTKVTREAGLHNKAWGLSAVIGDFNNDSWDDIFIANDFLEPDVMYINQMDGTFKDEILTRLKHITTFSMGSDYADLNNDLYPDLITLDMAATSHERSKENMASMSTSNFMAMVDIGYHHAYMTNMLHYNSGNGNFHESAQLSGISKTDWSWSTLIADFDNDGLKDIFITNGVDRDYTNQDARIKLKEVMKKGESMTIDAVLNTFPSEKKNNFIFKNNGDLSFNESIKKWGLEDPSFSYGATYADLDNDGDLDLITNNIEDKAGIYKNNSTNNYLQLKLKGSSKNPQAIGAKVFLLNNENTQFQQLYLTRGYKSSVTPNLNFGLGSKTNPSKIVVEWPDGKTSKLKDVEPNQIITIDYSNSTNEAFETKKYATLKNNIHPSTLGIDYQQQENNFNDYSLQLLIPQKQSTKGTGIAKADVNGDGLEDFFVGNASEALAALYIQKNDGTFTSTNNRLWKKEAKYEDSNALFFDADNDGDQDLYVVSAGYNLDKNSSLLQDRLYLNNGKGNFTIAKNALPNMLTSSKSVISGDYDGDGDLDLFVGGNVIPAKYPLPPHSYLLKNENGKFTEDTESNSSLSEIGMISEAIFTDYDKDQDLDLIIVGEWMAPTIFTNNKGVFEKETIAELDNTEGWWFSIIAEDFDGDGDQDYVLGNLGKNNKFHPSKEKPLFIYAKDFDDNGSLDVVMSKDNHGKLVPIRGKECSSQQNPFLLDKIQTYKEFAHFDMNEIYGEENLNDAYQLAAHTFESIYLENLGNGNFKSSTLPNEAQMGPTLSILSEDFNNDGFKDIMGIGAIYDAEVETIRYDSNFGYVLLGDGKGSFTYDKNYDPIIDSDAKDVAKIIINGNNYFIVVSNNAPLSIFNFKS